jgi:hypothetical protein
MQIIGTERINPAADIREHIRELPLLQAERKAITAAQSKLATVNTVAYQHEGKDHAARHGRQSPLELALWRAGEAFENDPSETTAAAVAQAAVVWSASDAVHSAFAEIAHNTRNAVSASLLPVATAMIDRAEKLMNEQLEKSQAVLDAALGLQNEARIFARKVEAAHELVASQRQLASEDPLAWILQEIGIEL